MSEAWEKWTKDRKNAILHYIVVCIDRSTRSHGPDISPIKIGYQPALRFIIVVWRSVVITAFGGDDKIFPVIGAAAAEDKAKAIAATLEGKNHVTLAEGASPEMEKPL